jgi:ankyrin repeat protein
MKMKTVDHLLAAVLDGEAQRAAEFVRADPGLLRARNMFGVSAVHAAHFTGRAELASRLLPSDPPDFFLAAELGRLDVIEGVLGRQPGLARDFDGRGSTALHGACYWGQAEAARRLLRAGADPSAPTRDQFLQIAPLGSAIATTPGVPQPSDDEDAVLALVRLLLEHGADPHQARRDGMTPLHSAAWRGLGRVAQELIDAGASPSAVATAGPHGGQTPADTALSQGYLVLAARLDTGAAQVASPYG